MNAQPRHQAETGKPSRWWYLYLAIALAAVSLATTYGMVFDPVVQAFFATNGDSQAIAGNAMAADWSDVWRWWTGPWIQHEMYYRPLSSMLFLAEGHLFGVNFQPYCMVSWAANALNVALLFLLGASLARGSRKAKLAIGTLTAALFLLAKHPEISQGPGYRPAPVGRIASGVMPWWPVQTDIFSMLCGLLSLLLLDRYLLNGRTRYLTGALASFVAALLFKEMALCIPLLVPLLVLYRRRDRVLTVSAWYFGLGIAFYAVRSVAAPAASGLEYHGIKTFSKLAFYLINRLTALVITGEWFPIAGSLVLLLIVLVMTWKRIEWIWTGLIALLWLLGSAQFIGGTFGLLTIADVLGRLGTMLLFWGGLFLIVLVRDRGVSVALVVAVVATCIPVLNRMGPHYWYWPLAFYALLNASLLNRLYEVSFHSDAFSLIVRRSSNSSA